MPEYLLEVGTEELPADQVPEAQERLKAHMSEALTQANVKFGSLSTMGTPRRLILIVHDIAAVQDTVQKKVAGPPVKSSFDASGKPLVQASGFAEKYGLTVDALSREEIGGVEKLVANLTIKGKPVAEVLAEIVPQSILKLSGDRLMRWGSCEIKFSRPIRWIVSLLDNQEVPVKLAAIKSGRETFGNRVLAPGAVQISDAKSYVGNLKQACVMPDPAARKQQICQEVEKVASSVGGKPRQLGGALLDEVVNITEWPHAVLGQFEDDYLDLPERLIETIMIHHQRYFPVERADGGSGQKKLLPYFVTVANNDRREAEPVIKQGNERVIRARLADGRFFYFDDQKTTLLERMSKLKDLTWQEGLGSYEQKVAREFETARILIDSLHLEPRIAIPLERTMELCKLDLVTNLVRELPELQGYVGSWYAEQEGQPPEVVHAIASHYAPRFQGDPIPADTVGQFAALIDKLDHLVGLFALGYKPTGSNDPYALRRTAQGLVDILMDGLTTYEVNVTALVETLFIHFEPMVCTRKNFDAQKVIQEIREFVLQRLRTKLMDKGYGREVIEAVLGVSDPLYNLPDVVTRCTVVQKMLADAEGANVVRIGVRVGGILKGDSPESVDASIFDIDAEKQLWNDFQSAVVAKWESNGHFKQPRSDSDYVAMLQLLRSLVAPVDLFFEKVMVDDPDQRKRNNRHGMLKNIYRYFGAIADFPKLRPLLP